MNPAGGCRLPMSKTATPKVEYQVDTIAIPFALAALSTARQVAFVAAGSETVSFAQTYVPSPRSRRMRIPTAGFARMGGERHTTRRSEEHTSELQSRQYLVCRLLLEKKKK